MRFLSVCSGIEAASVAWNPLGWKAAGFSEIEPFPCAVLAHHYPDTPNHGDMTKFEEWPDANVDLLCGGTPCQSFSVAGLRKGLADPRGNLMLTFGAIAAKYRPRWLVWENVPGVLSSNGGRDFGAFLGMLGQLGYGFAYRILDAQHFGVPQRRRRVFVVGCLGDWRRAASVLFERHSLSGHPAPRRKQGKGTAHDIAPRLDASFGRLQGCSGQDANHGRGHLVPGYVPEVARCDTTGEAKRQDWETCNFVAFDTTQITSPANRSSPKYGDPCHTLSAGAHAPAVAFNARQDHDHWQERTWPLDTDGGTQAVAFAQNSRDEVREMPYVGALAAEPGMKQTSYIRSAMQVRRLTPRECARLQGFPDDYLDIPYRGKPAADGPKYKALGNSWAVPVVRWIGERIQEAA